MRRLWRGEERRSIHFYCAVTLSDRFFLFLPTLLLPSLTHSFLKSAVRLLRKLLPLGCNNLQLGMQLPPKHLYLPNLVAISQITTIMFFNCLTCNSGPLKSDLILPLIISRKALHTKIIPSQEDYFPNNLLYSLNASALDSLNISFIIFHSNVETTEMFQ